MKPPFKLVHDSVSHNTVECLETLLEHAKRGEIIGLAYAAQLRQRAYITDTAGECYRNPTFARGMVGALVDCLSERMHSSNLQQR
jgi:hypothetical protein